MKKFAVILLLSTIAISAHAKDTVMCPSAAEVNAQELGTMSIPVVSSEGNAVVFSGDIGHKVKGLNAAGLWDGKLICRYYNGYFITDFLELTAEVPAGSTFGAYTSGDCVAVGLHNCAVILGE